MTTAEGRKPDPVDLHVGREIAARRQLQGFTQSDLAKALGLTFQQVQKYEKGSNRVSASKLHRIAAFLGNSPGSFFPPSDDPNPTEETSAAGKLALEILNAGGLNLVRDFLSLDHGRREIVRQVARTMTHEVLDVTDLAGTSTVLGATRAQREGRGTADLPLVDIDRAEVVDFGVGKAAPEVVQGERHPPAGGGL